MFLPYGFPLTQKIAKNTILISPEFLNSHFLLVILNCGTFLGIEHDLSLPSPQKMNTLKEIIKRKRESIQHFFFQKSKIMGVDWGPGRFDPETYFQEIPQNHEFVEGSCAFWRLAVGSSSSWSTVPFKAWGPKRETCLLVILRPARSFGPQCLSGFGRKRVTFLACALLSDATARAKLACPKVKKNKREMNFQSLDRSLSLSLCMHLCTLTRAR